MSSRGTSGGKISICNGRIFFSTVNLQIPAIPKVTGNVLVCGQGDVGQLGLGEDVPEKTRPALLADIKDIVDVQAGGMHSVALTSNGELFTFGCNDEGALGRDTSEEGAEYLPGKVNLPGKVVKVTCGDSHTACLLSDGRVFAWGSFRDSHGNMGLTLEGNKREPVHLLREHICVSIASGADHLVILTKRGHIYTVGCAEQGQLGRISLRSAGGESRRGKTQLLQAEHVPIKAGRVLADAIWATTYSTFVRDKATGKIYSFGLNNYSQLNIGKKDETLFVARETKFTNVKDLAGGSHHTLILTNDGKVYAIGRKDYGRLGLGQVEKDVDELTHITALQDKQIIQIACGDCTSFAIAANGEIYAWGIGSNSQLGIGGDEDAWEPTLLTGAQVKGKKIVRVSGGAQHTLFVVETPAEVKTNGQTGKAEKKSGDKKAASKETKEKPAEDDKKTNGDDADAASK